MESSSSSPSSADQINVDKSDVTFFMAEYFHNILFKPLCAHMDSLITQGPICKYDDHNEAVW